MKHITVIPAKAGIQALELDDADVRVIDHNAVIAAMSGHTG